MKQDVSIGHFLRRKGVSHHRQCSSHRRTCWLSAGRECHAVTNTDSPIGVDSGPNLPRHGFGVPLLKSSNMILKQVTLIQSLDTTPVRGPQRSPQRSSWVANIKLTDSMILISYRHHLVLFNLQFKFAKAILQGCSPDTRSALRAAVMSWCRGQFSVPKDPRIPKSAHSQMLP